MLCFEAVARMLAMNAVSVLRESDYTQYKMLVQFASLAWVIE